MVYRLLAAPLAASLAAGLATGCADPATAQPTTDEPTKLALLVGINEYEDGNIRSLRGGLNDVARMEHLLVSKFDFAQENILPLTNDAATASGILTGFREHLIDKTVVGRDDIVVFYYSGHGSQVPDEQCGDESDGLDETIVPWDSTNSGANDITDDDINDLLQELSERTRNITLVVDSCSSGNVHRGVGQARRVVREHQLPAPCPDGSPRGGTAEVGLSGLRREDVRFTLIAATRSNELAREYEASDNGSVYGAMTYFLTEELLRAPQDATYRDVLDVVQQSVVSLHPNQHVELEGTAADSLVFGATDVLQESYVPVMPGESATEVVLRAGQIHGLTKGSVFEIYPPRTRVFSPPASPLASAELFEVAADRSKARLRAEVTIPAGSRAVEREHRYEDRQLWVRFVDPGASPVLAGIKADLSRYEIVRAAPTTDKYHLLLDHDRVADELVLEAADGAVLQRWPASEPAVGQEIAGAVKKWAKWFNVLSISNPHPSPKVRVDFTVEAVTSRGATRSPFAHVGRPDAEFREGESVRMLVKNRSRYDLYLSILDLSTDGSVTLIYDKKQPSLEKGQVEPFTLESGTYVPPGFDFVTDTLLLFATREYVDFSFLDREPIVEGEARMVPGVDDPLERLVARAALGTRGIEGALPLNGWTTAKRVIRVTRRAP